MKFVASHAYISQLVARSKTIFFICGADHVAVPDFSGGAMENWGLVLYRETALLYEPGVSSSENKLMVTLIIAHEVAHTVRNECNHWLIRCLHLINGTFFVFLFFVSVMG